MNRDEEKKEEGRRPEGGGPKGKHRRLQGSQAIALESLVTLLLVFASDLKCQDISVEDAAEFFAENLDAYMRKYVRTHG